MPVAARADEPRLSRSGDIHQGPVGDHVPGALGDYAACAGSLPNSIDYWWDWKDNQGNPVPPANGAFWYGRNGSEVRRIRLTDIRDGTTNTFLFGEKHIPNFRFGAAPDSSIYNGDHGSSFKHAGPSASLARGPQDTGGRFGSYHDGVCQFVFCDGSVKAIRVSIDTTTLGYLANRRDGQVIAEDF